MKMVVGKKTAGFTLVEMLIAVVIMAVVGTTLATTIGSVAGQTYALERRTVANWVALNELAKLRIDLRANPRALAEGKSTARLFMGDREWEVRTSVIATEHPLLRRVEVDVFEVLSGDRNGPYDHLIAFVGRH
jgi:general secretion pathway protein I